MALVASSQTTHQATTRTSEVHIRVQQRNGRKCVTTVQGLAEDLDQKKICKFFRKRHNTNGSVVKVKGSDATVIQVQGDQRQAFNAFLTDHNICLDGEIKIHGF